MYVKMKKIFNKKMMPWPKTSSMPYIQQFVNQICEEYSMQNIEVKFYPKWFIEQYSTKAVGMAWPIGYSDVDSIGEVWFCTEYFGYPCASFKPKKPVKEASEIQKIRVIIHEFAHHVAWKTYGYDIKAHGKEFRKINRSIESKFGFYTIPFFYSIIKFPHIWFKQMKNSGEVIQ
jgi:hypothetical protein